MPTPMIGLCATTPMAILVSFHRPCADPVRSVLDVGDGAEARHVAVRQERRHAHREQQQPDGGAGRFPPTRTARNITKMAASVRKPARENVRITAATLSSNADAATMRLSAARDTHQHARNGNDQVQHQREVVRITGQPRPAHVALDPGEPAYARRELPAGQVVADAGRGERNGAQHERPGEDAQAIGARDDGAEQPEEGDRLQIVIEEHPDAAAGPVGQRDRQHRPADQHERDPNLRRERRDRLPVNRPLDDMRRHRQTGREKRNPDHLQRREPCLRRQQQDDGEGDERDERQAAARRRRDNVIGLATAAATTPPVAQSLRAAGPAGTPPCNVGMAGTRRRFEA